MAERKFFGKNKNQMRNEGKKLMEKLMKWKI